MLFWNWFAWVFNFMDRGLIGPLLPLMIPYFGITNTQAGFLVSLFFVGYLTTSIGGVLADKIGRKNVITPSIFGFGLTTTITSIVSTVPQLAIVRVITGVFEGFQYPSGAAWVSEVYPYSKRGGALGVWESGYSIGTVLGTLVATLMGAWLGWRAPWITGGLASIVVGVLVAKFVKERPREETPAHDEQLVFNPKKENHRLRDVFRIRNVWVVFILHGLYNFTVWMAGAWMPTYAENIKDMTFVAGGLLSTIFYGGTTIGLVVSGYMSNKVGRKKLVSVMAILSAASMFAFTQVSNDILIFIFVALSGLLGAYLSQLIPLVTDVTNPAISGTAFGVALFGGEIGAVAGPFFGGAISDIAGLHVAIYALPVASILAFATIWLAHEPSSWRVSQNHINEEVTAKD